MPRTFVKTLDLVDDPEIIARYEEAHRHVWPEILEGIRSVGITRMDIYRLGSRLVMVMELPEELDYDQTFDKLARLPKQAEWEEYVGQFQICNPGDTSAGKWKPMTKIFSLD